MEEREGATQVDTRVTTGVEEGDVNVFRPHLSTDLGGGRDLRPAEDLNAPIEEEIVLLSEESHR